MSWAYSTRADVTQASSQVGCLPRAWRRNSIISAQDLCRKNVAEVWIGSQPNQPQGFSADRAAAIRTPVLGAVSVRRRCSRVGISCTRGCGWWTGCGRRRDGRRLRRRVSVMPSAEPVVSSRSWEGGRRAVRSLARRAPSSRSDVRHERRRRRVSGAMKLSQRTPWTRNRSAEAREY